MGKFFLLILVAFTSVNAKSQAVDEEDRKKLLAYITPARDSSSKVFNLLMHVRNGRLTGYNYDSLYSAYQSLAMKRRQREKEFIRQNPTSYAALEHFKAYILNSINYRPDSVVEIFSFFSKDLKATPLGKTITETLEKKESLGLNNEMPNFSFITNTGEKLSLSSFHGQKFVLLCFWDSWCGPCIRSIPTLKKIAAIYSQGLQLIHVSIDQEEGKWLSSLKKYSMPWPQTCDLAPYITGKKVSSMYDIEFIPQYYLIDKDGKLLYQNVLVDDNDEYTKLQEVLHKVIVK